MIQTRLLDALTRIDRDLRALDARWALVGGFGVSARSEPRTTRDVDVAVAVAGDPEAEDLLVRLRDRGYIADTLMEHRDVPRLATARLLRRRTVDGAFIDLLFATAGIEPEVAAEADLLEVLPGLTLPVAKTGHLLALKILALRPERLHERPQDQIDIRELLRVADDDEVQRARLSVRLISERGFDRGKNLERELDRQLREFRRSAEADEHDPRTGA